jgi:hypothetical protein
MRTGHMVIVEGELDFAVGHSAVDYSVKVGITEKRPCAGPLDGMAIMKSA